MIKRFIENKIDIIMESFVEKQFIDIPEATQIVLETRKNSFRELLSFTIHNNLDGICQGCKNLAQLNIKYNIPYVVLINEIEYLKNCVADILFEEGAKSEIYDLYKLYRDIENVVAFEYLQDYVEKLLGSNRFRVASLNDMLEKNIVNHYEEHLNWLNILAKAIRNFDSNNMPELNPCACNFGKWLKNEGKEVIKNNSKLKEIESAHKFLHSLASVVHKQLNRKHKDFNVLVSYLERCEMISLAIGTELALIDNSIMIKKAAKDEMTGALNRNSLSQIFTNQYELSTATGTPFALGMCDLDYFKKLNDTYGHIAGDMMLKSFVELAKSLIRDSDVVIRYGGEEFIILLANTNMENAKNKLEKIRLNFQNFVLEYDNKQISTTLSIGVIEILPQPHLGSHKIKVEDFIQKADLKLYEAKNSGRNRVIY